MRSVIVRSKGIDKGLLCLPFEQVKEFGTQAFAARCGQRMELKTRNHGSSSSACGVTLVRDEIVCTGTADTPFFAFDLADIKMAFRDVRFLG